ncbi:beta-lactamase superfamily II metal-dependent hydrolase [Amycolatopsis viridis]|uniref:Beta-lactamase superfamily II metal-dependent hydrolase n=1 Tax=Amycolatopsis viridis TaxID=185678 RepID=A0ABX0SYG5_9PSEU|nr:beta-lactamase superfamily II metal-dependent hydrolase [Amycolatopsis viridis]
MAVSFGFALSVIATAGLVLLAPRWAEVLQHRGVPAGVAEGLAVPAAAFVVTAPVVAGMAGQLSVVSVAANVLAAPVVASATVFGVLATLVAVVWPSGGEVVARLAGPEAGWLIVVARRASAVPGAVLPWPGGWWGGFLALVVATAVVLALRRRGLRVLLALILVGGLLIVVPGKVIAPGWPPARWTVVACDVGQGDALALATGEPGRAIVVDTGPEPGPVDRCLDRLGVERVPLVVLSHLHADHIGGLASVFEGRTVGAVAVGPGRQPDWAWRQVGQIAARHGVPLLELEPGRRLEWPALTLEVLGPGYVSEEEDDDGTQINNGSVVLRAATPAGRVLLTGDVELAAQADLLASGADVRADVIKVPHHGSRFSLPQFLAAVSARLALVSVGSGNRYGHPNRTTLDTLTADGALVARTDTDGDTAVIPDQSGPAVVRRGK